MNGYLKGALTGLVSFAAGMVVLAWVLPPQPVPGSDADASGAMAMSEGAGAGAPGTPATDARSLSELARVREPVAQLSTGGVTGGGEVSDAAEPAAPGTPASVAQDDDPAAFPQPPIPQPSAQVARVRTAEADHAESVPAGTEENVLDEVALTDGATAQDAASIDGAVLPEGSTEAIEAIHEGQPTNPADAPASATATQANADPQDTAFAETVSAPPGPEVVEVGESIDGLASDGDASPLGPLAGLTDRAVPVPELSAPFSGPSDASASDLAELSDPASADPSVAPSALDAEATRTPAADPILEVTPDVAADSASDLTAGNSVSLAAPLSERDEAEAGTPVPLMVARLTDPEQIAEPETAAQDDPPAPLASGATGTPELAGLVALSGGGPEVGGDAQDATTDASSWTATVAPEGTDPDPLLVRGPDTGNNPLAERAPDSPVFPVDDTVRLGPPGVGNAPPARPVVEVDSVEGDTGAGEAAAAFDLTEQDSSADPTAVQMEPNSLSPSSDGVTPAEGEGAGTDLAEPGRAEIEGTQPLLAVSPPEAEAIKDTVPSATAEGASALAPAAESGETEGAANAAEAPVSDSDTATGIPVEVSRTAPAPAGITEGVSASAAPDADDTETAEAATSAAQLPDTAPEGLAETAATSVHASASGTATTEPTAAGTVRTESGPTPPPISAPDGRTETAALLPSGEAGAPEPRSTAPADGASEGTRLAPGQGRLQPAPTGRLTPGSSVVGVTVGRLPQVGTAEPAPVAEAAIDQPDAPDSAEAPRWRRHASQVPASHLPRVGLVLLDVSRDLAAEAALVDLTFAVTVGLDPFDPDSLRRALIYRAAGHEIVLTLDGVSPLSTASDLEVLFDAWLTDFPEVIGVVDVPPGDGRRSRALAQSLVPLLRDAGLALIAPDRGLSPLLSAARAGGVAQAGLYRSLDPADETADAVRRFLDRAAFEAERQGSIAVIGRADREETRAGIVDWLAGTRAARVQATPVGAVLTVQGAN
jgi:uncharacterized protein